jgi:MYXO-CTERM domain-containing protein
MGTGGFGAAGTSGAAGHGAGTGASGGSGCGCSLGDGVAPWPGAFLWLLAVLLGVRRSRVAR